MPRRHCNSFNIPQCIFNLIIIVFFWRWVWHPIRVIRMIVYNGAAHEVQRKQIYPHATSPPPFR